jgi:hypothetical protein
VQNKNTLSRLKAIWRDQIFADRDLTSSCFKVGYAMADYMTMNKTAAWFRRHGDIVIFPSQEELRKRTHLSPDTIRVSIAQLIEGGHLRRWRRGNQFTGSNRYKVIIKDEQR